MLVVDIGDEQWWPLIESKGRVAVGMCHLRTKVGSGVEGSWWETPYGPGGRPKNPDKEPFRSDSLHGLPSILCFVRQCHPTSGKWEVGKDWPCDLPRALPYRSGRMQVSLCLALTRPNAFGCPYGRKDCYCLPQCQQLHFRAFFRPGSMLGALVSVLIRACISVSFSTTAHWGRPYFPLTEEQTGSRG